MKDLQKLNSNYIIKCPAKINLFLNITGKHGSMHTLNTINQSVTLYDYLYVEVINSGDIIIESNYDIPLDMNNSVYKAIKLMKDLFNIYDSFKINIIKNIPLKSGLGGESTDAAGIVLFMNMYYNLNLSIEKLFEIGYKIGHDVPFCLYGMPSHISNNNIKPFIIPNYYYLIIKPKISLETKYMYDLYDSVVTKFNKLELNFGVNDFEKIVPNEILLLKNELLQKGACFSNLTGSGSAIIGAYSNKKNQINSYNYFKEIYDSYMVKPCNGIKILKK